MPTRPGSRFTIGNAMFIIAGAALTLGLAMTPGLGSILGSFLMLVFLGLIGSLLAVRRVIELTYGIRCPSCGKRGLERRAVLSFGERFFLCPSCGIRCRRSLLGAYGLFLWRDASGAAFQAYYQKPATEDPWNAPPGLEDDDYVYSKTHVNLVRNKRRRSPDNPNGPGLG